MVAIALKLKNIKMKEQYLKNILNSLSGDTHEKEKKVNGIQLRISEADTLDTEKMQQYAFAMYKGQFENIRDYFDSHYVATENTDEDFTSFTYTVEDEGLDPIGTEIPMAVRVVEKNSAFYVQFRMEFVHIQ